MVSHGFTPLRNVDADLARVQEEILQAFNTLASQVTPAAAWQGVTLATHSQLRRQHGDLAGVKGPRAAIVAGRAQTKDGGEGVFLWDPASVLPDDDTSVISTGAAQGRWRKLV